MNMGDAATLKQRGNELFKAGSLTEAAELYAKAEHADPIDPVYPSNLSAALYEIGDYAKCADAVMRSWNLLKDKTDAKPDLILRLSTRLAKSLCHGVRAGTVSQDSLVKYKEDIMLLQEAAAKRPASAAAGQEHGRVWEDWETVKLEMDDYAKKGEACLGGLSRLPLFLKSLDHAREFFSMGQDEIIDLTRGWGPRDKYPLDLLKLPESQLSEVAFLFGGVGDGRHVLGTLSGLYEAYKKLPAAKKSKFKAHLTLLDIHDGTMARDLCVLTLLDQLSDASDPIVKAEIQATLMYMFCGAVMPSYCYDRLMGVIDDLRERLSKDPDNQPAWLHVVSDTIPAVVAILDYWRSTTKSTRKMLEAHKCINPAEDPTSFGYNASSIPGANADFQKVINQKMDAEREMFKMMLLNMPEAQLAQMLLPPLPADAPISEKRVFVQDNIDTLGDEFMRMFGGGKVPRYEQSWYRIMKAFFPPMELRVRHPCFADTFTQASSWGEFTPAVERQVKQHIEREWKANITLFDFSHAHPRYYPDRDGFPNLRLNVFDIVAVFDGFNRRNDPNGNDSLGIGKGGKKLLAWEVCDAFFGEAAAALKGLESRVTLELICGGLSEELAKMRFKGDLTRLAAFPRKYTRMWLSNVPDYTHGPMNMILYVVPNLQDHPQAAVACNCLFNMGAWGGDAEFVHTRSAALPRLSDQRLSRLCPSQIRLPHNLVAFFGLLMYLHRVGYPGHWLSDFLSRVLSGRMLSDIVPYQDKYLIPINERHHRVKSRRVRTDPWLVEFETIIATVYHAIPFPVASALPADFSRDAQDIALWEVRVQPPADFWHHPSMRYNTGDEPRAQLLFYWADLVSASTPIDGIERIFEGGATPAPGTFFVLTAVEHVQYDECVRFRLSRRRVERMRREKWNMLAYRNDSAQQATRPVPIQMWRQL
ncbi:hypothetical protein GSI_08829 [Ganoderma sinense ZZ0214-1]|uniref:DUF4470 domain-containing protein n=1 Tax=Ganoderma sinense ZZ0214-1 TaxID=1077348 RepID=A0A2G8S4W2_9APHY|nr:hypothetical protein GSI_08829 [Ganoderma sinense ZZ0214-1]